MVQETPVEAAGKDWGLTKVVPFWPQWVLEQSQANKSSRSVVGLGVGFGLAYVLWGNPMAIVQSRDLASIGLLYVTIGAGVVVGAQLSDKIESSQ